MKTFASIVLSAVIMTVTAQQTDLPPPENCAAPPQGGCASQPVIIQLSCGGNQGGPSRPPPNRPPPNRPPPMMMTPPMSDYHNPYNYYEPASVPTQIAGLCEVDQNGRFIGNPPGGYPEGLLFQIENGMPIITLPPSVPSPPPYWDGNMQTLGFPMPAEGTPLYNMLMCWPIPVTTGRR